MAVRYKEECCKRCAWFREEFKSNKRTGGGVCRHRANHTNRYTYPYVRCGHVCRHFMPSNFGFEVEKI